MNDQKFSPLVVGLPRTGFSLLISIIVNAFNRVENRFDARCMLYREFCKTFGSQISSSVVKVFEKHGLKDDIFFNNNFRYMIGGPIWNKDKPGTKAYFRKYIGAGSLGDFTLITSHPIRILDAYEVIHSHGPFSQWTHIEPFSSYTRLASVRKPIAALNSACHSINALASEYIQKVRPDIDVEKTRIELASSKLSNEEFFRALMSPMKRGLIDLIETKKEYMIVNWEDMVTTPFETIKNLYDELDLSLTQGEITEIWKNIGFRNLTGSHKHNYRKGKAFVGDEMDSITNEHIDMLREEGFDDISRELGYEPPEYINEKDYNDFQKNVSNALKKGKTYDLMEDRLLYDYAFNKSNLDFEKFGFRLYDWRDHTRIERSNIEDPALELDVSDIAEEKTALVNKLAEVLIEDSEDGTVSSRFRSEAVALRDEFEDVDVSKAINRLENVQKKSNVRSSARALRKVIHRIRQHI